MLKRKKQELERVKKERSKLAGVEGAEEQRHKLLRQAGKLAVEILRLEQQEKAAQLLSRAAHQENKQKMKVTVKSRATLVNAPRIVADKLKEMLTLDNPAYVQAQRHGRYCHHLPPKIYLWSEDDQGLHIPRGLANPALHMARESGVQPTVHDLRRGLPAIDLQFSGTLRDYQQAALDDLLRREFGVLEAATGSGKTVMGLAVIAERRQPTLILVHNKELLAQWADRIRSFLGIEPGLIGDGKYEIQPVTVAIVNTARKHLDSLPEYFGHIVVDECHRTPSSMFTEVVQAFDSKFMLGLSATAYRRDGLTRIIYFTLGQKVHSVDKDMLNKTGAVLKPRVFAQLTEFRYNYQDDYSRMLSSLTQDDKRNNQIAKDVVHVVNKQSGTALVVSDRVQHCQDLADLIQDSGLQVRILTGQCSKSERESIVAQVQAGKVDVLCSTVQLLGEGFDCSGLSSLFLATPIKFKGRLLQVVGRILRPAEDKEAVIIDYIDDKQPLLKAQARKRWKYLKEIAQ